MPQLFQVLRCYKCLVFQIHQTKKSCKFACKLCGEKQSIKRHYGLGTAKDCRLHVQKLNVIRGEVDEIIEQNGTDSSEEQEINATESSKYQRSKLSKWSEYVEKEEVTETVSDETMYLGNTEVVLDVPRKRPKPLKRNNYFKSKIFKPPNNVHEYKEEFSSTSKKTPPKTIDHFDNTTNTENNISSKDSQLQSLLKCDGSLMNPNPQYIDFESEHVICKKEEKNPQNKFMPPKTNTHINSKWAQFMDTEEANNTMYDDEDASNAENSHSEPQILFSLCDDADLDDVLDI